MNRRDFLNLVGKASAVTAIAATGALTWRAADQGVFRAGRGPAYAAWREWNLPGPAHLSLVRAAILAANAHDSQPWRFRVGPTSVDLYADAARTLGTIDPLRREMYISLGCGLENLLLAAQATGLTPTLRVMPDRTDLSHVAHVDLSPGQTAVSALYLAIPHRHTNRYPYDDILPMAPETLSMLSALIDAPDVTAVWLTGGGEKRAFADLTVRATEAFIADPQQAADDYSWYRNDWHQLQSLKDGITIDASGLPPLTVTLAKIFGASRQQDDQGWLQNTRAHVATATAFGVLATRDRQDNSQRVEAGRIWQRMHLWATIHGVAMQPLNQVVERMDREQSAGLPPDFTRAVGAMMPTGWEAVMPFRIGYSTHPAPASPRRPAEEVVAYS